MHPLNSRYGIVLIVPALQLLAALLGVVLMQKLGFLPESIFDLSNEVGSHIQNLIDGRGFVSCTTDHSGLVPGTCAYADRSPFPIFLIAGLTILFGDHLLTINITKALMAVLPLCLASMVALRAVAQISSPKVQASCVAILLMPLIIPTFLINAVNMQVEEGYTYSLIALCFSLLLFGSYWNGLGRSIAFGMSLTLLYLSKSSMLALCIFFGIAYFIFNSEMKHRIAFLVLAIIGPLAWSAYTYESTQHWTLGTSWDGLNLYKGENELLIERYPPADGGTLDRWDSELFNNGDFSNEWAAHSFYKKKAINFIAAHPQQAAILAAKKFHVFFLTFRKIGSQNYTGFLGTPDRLSLYPFRFLQWIAAAIALYSLSRRPAKYSRAALLLIGTYLFTAAPYIIGFSFTRHSSVTLYPAVLYICSSLVRFCGVKNPNTLIKHFSEASLDNSRFWQ